jgi:hypothetical protein
MLDGSQELWDQVRARIIRPGGLFYFCQGLIGFPDLTYRCHMPICLFLEDETVPWKLLEYPRKHLKTSIATVGHTLWIFARRVVKGEDPIDRVGIASSTKTNAMRFLRLISFTVEQNVLFQNFLPELLPEFGNEDVWNREEIIFPRKRTFTDPSVDTIGAGGKPASRHFTIFKEDDMVNEENWDSPTAIKKAIELHQLYEGLLEGAEDPRLTCENSWTDYDLNRHIVDNEPDTAILSVGATGKVNPKRSRNLPKIVERMCLRWEQDDESIWPERFDKAALDRIRRKVGARIYNAQFENQPFDPDVVDFKEEWLRYFEFDHNGDIRIVPQRGIEMEIVKINSLYKVAAFDPALSEKTTAARSALVIHGVDPKGRVFQLDTIATRRNPLPVLGLVFEAILKWGVMRCAVEKVLFQQVLVDLLQERCTAFNEDMAGKGRDTRIYSGIFEPIGPEVYKRAKGHPGRGQAKPARIRALIGTAFEEGKVYIRREQTEFIDEYLHHPIGKTMDLLDAFAYAASLWAPGEDEDEVEERERAEAAYLAQRDPVTGY